MNKFLKIVTLFLTVSNITHAGEAMEKPQSNMNQEQKIEIVAEVARAFGREIDPDDPKTLQAAEAFIVSDAGKAYAFTKVYAVPLEFCEDKTELLEAKNKYIESAKDIIRLGEYYYTYGFDLQLGDKRMVRTGEELVSGLEKMLDKMRGELEGLDKDAIDKKCSDSVKAFASLAQLYGS